MGVFKTSHTHSPPPPTTCCFKLSKQCSNSRAALVVCALRARVSAALASFCACKSLASWSARASTSARAVAVRCPSARAASSWAARTAWVCEEQEECEEEEVLGGRTPQKCPYLCMCGPFQILFAFQCSQQLLLGAAQPVVGALQGAAQGVNLCTSSGQLLLGFAQRCQCMGETLFTLIHLLLQRVLNAVEVIAEVVNHLVLASQRRLQSKQLRVFSVDTAFVCLCDGARVFVHATVGIVEERAELRGTGCKTVNGVIVMSMMVVMRCGRGL